MTGDRTTYVRPPQPVGQPLVFDPVGDLGRAELDRHDSRTWEVETDDGWLDHQIRVTPTGRGWMRCGCGWSPNLPTVGSSRPMAMPSGEAWRAWARHVPPAVHAYRFAVQRWRDDFHRPMSIVPAPPPEGWDAPGGPYDWRTWSVTVTDRDDGGVSIAVRWPT